jgi:hypothetical protein
MIASILLLAIIIAALSSMRKTHCLSLAIANNYRLQAFLAKDPHHSASNSQQTDIQGYPSLISSQIA